MSEVDTDLADLVTTLRDGDTYRATLGVSVRHPYDQQKVRDAIYVAMNEAYETVHQLLASFGLEKSVVTTGGVTGPTADKE